MKTINKNKYKRIVSIQNGKYKKLKIKFIKTLRKCRNKTGKCEYKFYNENVIESFFQERLQDSLSEYNKIDSGLGYASYYEGMEDEGAYIEYFEENRNKTGLSPFDLIPEKYFNELILV